MKKNFKAGGQGGFTLIELIVVIVVLGILAATALPKFAGLSADARASSTQAVKGALSSTAAMVHGKFLINPSGVATSGVNLEGTAVTVTNGYPTASTALATAAGLGSSDYSITADTAAGTLTVSPNSVTTPASCKVVYTNAASTNAAPSIVATTTDCN